MADGKPMANQKAKVPSGLGVGGKGDGSFQSQSSGKTGKDETASVATSSVSGSGPATKETT